MRLERQVLFWVLAALALLAAIALLRDVLLPFVAGMVIAYFLNPLADGLERIGLNRTVATALIVAGGAVVMAAAMFFLAPILSEQLRQLAETLPGKIDRFKLVLDGWVKERAGAAYPSVRAALDRAFDDVAKAGSGSLAVAVRALWSQGLALVNFISLLLITPVVVFYLLADWHKMVARIDSWLPREHAPTIRRLATDANNAVAGFIRGQGTVCLILGVFYGLALSFVGLNYGLLIGIATGVFAFIPVVGWTLGLVVSVALALAQFWPETVPVALVAGVFVAGQALDSALLSPRIVGSRIGLHPVWMIFALFAFSYLFGFVGMILAVPLSAALAVLVRYFLDVYLSSGVYTGGADPKGADAKVADRTPA